MTARLLEVIKTWREELKADRKARKTTDFEANPEEEEAVVDPQEISNEKATIHSLKGCGKERMIC
jgi:hypothetical protein